MRDMADIDEDIDMEMPHIHVPDDIHISVDQFEILSNLIIFDE